MKTIVSALLLSSCLSCLAAEPCKDNPYKIQTGSVALSGQITLPPSLVGNSLKPSANTAAAGLAFSRTMYAAMAPTVVQEVLDVYTCLVEKAIDEDATKSAEEKAVIKDVWKNAVGDITGTLAGYVVTLMASPETFGSVNPALLTNRTLTVEDRSVVPYLGVIKPENFTVIEGYQLYMKATINGITGTACGSYLRQALASNAGNIQHFAAAVRPIINEYFSDSKNSVRYAKAKLYIQASGISLAVAPTETSAKNNQSQCML